MLLLVSKLLVKSKANGWLCWLFSLVLETKLETTSTETTGTYLFAESLTEMKVELVEDVTIAERLIAYEDELLILCGETGLELALHCAGDPMQIGFFESFNGRMRDALLNETVFKTIPNALA